jgi:uncharacterized membrane protein YczE
MNGCAVLLLGWLCLENNVSLETLCILIVVGTAIDTFTEMFRRWMHP